MNINFGLLLAAAGLAALAWPRHGLVARLRQSQQFAARRRREDALKHLVKSEANGLTATLDSLAGALQIRTGKVVRVLEELEDRDLLTFEGGKLRLTPTGRELGLHIVRAHRLWESYLAEETGTVETQWHARAEKQEHLLTPQEADALAARLGHPIRDPHGDPIPGADAGLEEDESRSLNSVELDTPVVITHLEDEPEVVYQQLAALGLRPGIKVFIIEKSPTRIRFWANGDEHCLAPVLAENVCIKPLPELSPKDLVEEEFLSGLRPGVQAKVLALSPACRGPERRRLLDLGFVPGTAVEVEMVSPGGDPIAYRVRGSVVALRRQQASLIRIQSQEAVAA